MQRSRAGVLAVLLLVLFLSQHVQAAEGDGYIRVGLIQGQQQARIMSPGGFIAIDLSSGQLDQFQPNVTVTFASEGAGIRVGDRGLYWSRALGSPGPGAIIFKRQSLPG